MPLLIFFRQHDRHDAARFLGISCIFRMRGQIAIVTVDFRKERLPIMLDADETMVIPGVTLVVEGIESLDLLETSRCTACREAYSRRPSS